MIEQASNSPKRVVGEWISLVRANAQVSNRGRWPDGGCLGPKERSCPENLGSGLFLSLAGLLMVVRRGKRLETIKVTSRFVRPFNRLGSWRFPQENYANLCCPGRFCWHSPHRADSACRSLRNRRRYILCLQTDRRHFTAFSIPWTRSTPTDSGMPRCAVVTPMTSLPDAARLRRSTAITRGFPTRKIGRSAISHRRPAPCVGGGEWSAAASPCLQADRLPVPSSRRQVILTPRVSSSGDRPFTSGPPAILSASRSWKPFCLILRRTPTTWLTCRPLTSWRVT